MSVSNGDYRRYKQAEFRELRVTDHAPIHFSICGSDTEDFTENNKSVLDVDISLLRGSP